MRTFRTVALAAAATAGALLLAPAAAQAAPSAQCHHVHQQTGPNVGLLNGLNLYAPIGADLGVTDNALGLLGYATAAGGGTRTVTCS